MAGCLPLQGVYCPRLRPDTRSRVYYRDLQNPDSAVVELLNDFDASYGFIDNVGTTFYFRTDLDAPMGRLIAIDTANPARANWRKSRRMYRSSRRRFLG